jgi:signal transduction histidine kinase
MKKFRWSLPFKFTLSISIVIVITAVILSLFFVTSQIDQIRADLENRCSSLTRNLAFNSEYGVLTGNREFLVTLTEGLSREEDVIYSLVYSRDGRVLASSVAFWKNGIYRQVDSSYMQLKTPINGLKPSKEVSLTYRSEKGEALYEVSFPITVSNTPHSREDIAFMDFSANGGKGTIIGVARVGISLSRMDNQIARLSRGIFLITLLVVFSGILLATLFIRIIVKPLKELALGTQKIADGDLDYRVDIRSDDEIGDLAVSFNLMASDLKMHTEALHKEKEDLIRLKSALEQRTLELEETLSKIQSIQQELIRSEKFATIGRLSANVAHELRNPLASIKNISYFLMKTGAITDEKSKHMMEMLSTDVTRANKIVTDLLDYSRVRKPHKVPVHMDEFINKLIDKMSLVDNIHIVRELTAFEAHLDPDRIAQVLINLINNARDAMQNGGQITIKSLRVDDMAHIIISDTGCGMDRETADRIFEPLFTTKLKGLGLGLAIVKEIVDSHFGKIGVVSEKGKGTTFHISLPA